MVQAKQIKLKSYPEGMPKESDFETTQTDVNEADLKQDQLLVQLVEVSVDPYLRYRMAKPKTEEAFGSYKLNETVNSIGLARVLESKSDKFKKGDIITAWSLPWQEKSIISVKGVEKIPEVDLPLSYHLHSLGMTGLTAYFGLLSLCDPKPNEVVLVSAAAGAVGMLVGQIAKIKGAKVYGIAGGKEKVEFVKSLGFDDCLDYKSVSNMDDAIKKLCPDGIDVYFDNVGGETLDAVLLNLKMGARLSLCGSISQYNDKEEAKGPRRLFNLTTKNATMTGFLVGKFASEFGKAIQEIAQWVKEGKIKEQIDERKGFESIVPSFIDLFKGGNTGKVVVKVSE